MPLAATLSAHWSGISYIAPGRPANVNKRYSVFLPYGKRKPRDGWPWVVDTDNGAWIFQSLPTAFTKDGNGAAAGGAFIHDGFPWLALHNGIAIVAPTFTTTGQTGVAGLGTFKPPTHADFSLQDFSEVDGLQLVQHVNNHAQEYGLDPNRNGWNGSSSGAGPGLYSGLGPDCVGVQGFWPTGTTRVKAVCVYASQGLFNIIDPVSSAYVHFPLGVDHTQVALTIGAANSGYLEMASPIRYGFDTTMLRSSDILELNRNARVHLSCFTPAPVTGAFAAAPGPPLISANPAAVGWLTANYSPIYGQILVGSNDPFHNAVHMFGLKQIMVANGSKFGSSGGFCRLVTTFAARHLPTWASGATAAPYEDKVMGLMDLSAESEYTQERLAWFKAVFASL